MQIEKYAQYLEAENETSAIFMLGSKNKVRHSAAHKHWRQSPGSHYWYVVAGLPAFSTSGFSSSVHTNPIAMAPLSPECHSDH